MSNQASHWNILCVRFGDPSFIGFGYAMRINRQTYGGENRSTAIAVCVANKVEQLRATLIIKYS